MAQHLRTGSVINYGGDVHGPFTYENATVTNITDTYIEFEWTDPTTSQDYVIVRSLSLNAVIVVVTD